MIFLLLDVNLGEIHNQTKSTGASFCHSNLSREQTKLAAEMKREGKLKEEDN